MNRKEMISALAEIRDELVRDEHDKTRLTTLMTQPHDVPVGAVRVVGQPEQRVIRSSDPSMVAHEKTIVRTTLHTVMTTLNGWIESARDNHDALGHRGEDRECWTQFAPSDFRNMINDTARELGVAEFLLPKTPKEDEVR